MTAPASSTMRFTKRGSPIFSMKTARIPRSRICRKFGNDLAEFRIEGLEYVHIGVSIPEEHARGPRIGSGERRGDDVHVDRRFAEALPRTRVEGAVIVAFVVGFPLAGVCIGAVPESDRIWSRTLWRPSLIYVVPPGNTVRDAESRHNIGGQFDNCAKRQRNRSCLFVNATTCRTGAVSRLFLSSLVLSPTAGRLASLAAAGHSRPIADCELLGISDCEPVAKGKLSTPV